MPFSDIPYNLLSRPAWQRYFFAILVVATAAAVRVEFLGELGPRIPFVTFFPAVMIVAVCAGILPGLLATAMAASLAAYFMNPLGVLLIQSADRLGMATFAFSCIMMCVVAYMLHRAQKRATVAETAISLAKLRTLDEAKLRASEVRYEALFANRISGIAHCRVITDEHGRPVDYCILEVNDACQQILGTNKGDIEGRRVTEVFPGVENYAFDYVGTLGRIAIEGGEILTDTFLEATQQYLSIYAYSPLPGEFTAIFNDVTARKRAEQELVVLNAELEQRIKERTAELESALQDQESFSYSLSHDLRVPLHHINGYCTILIEDYGADLNSEAQGYLNKICASSNRMGGMISQLLEMSRVGRIEMVLEPVDLSELARQVFNMHRETDPQRRVEVAVAEGITVLGDRCLLLALLENLIGNAWKYTSKLPLAHIELGRTAGAADQVFFVNDDGVGFDMEFRHKLFTPFERLHGSEFAGTGVGLATSQRIVKRHGGTIWANGKVGEGATVFFTLSADA